MLAQSLYQRLWAEQKVLAIMGPTASGKTGLALRLAQDWPIEIISVDSALIYLGMDIGTAKPTKAELAQVPHHLIDILEPYERYSVSDFIADSEKLVAEIQGRERLPIFVGGTMMYFHALEQGLAHLPQADANLREDLQRQYQHSPHALHDKLAQVDPQAAERIHCHDPQRMIRALEVYYLTGQPLTQLQKQNHASHLGAQLIKIGLIPESRQALHRQIQQRLQTMFDQGFLQEVKQLMARGDLNVDMPAMRSVGYRQAWLYLSGELDEDSWQNKALVATRQLAKRQLTWLRKQQNMAVIDPYQMTLDERLDGLMDAIAKNLHAEGEAYGML